MLYEIHTYGGGDFLIALLGAIKLLMGGDAFATFIKIFALLGLLTMIGWAVFSLRLELSWIVWFVLVYLGFFAPKVDIAVIDHLAPANTQVVTGVPALLGIFAGLSSQIGDGLTRMTEQSFAIPAEVRFRDGGGYAGAVRMLQLGLDEQTPKPYVSGSAARFVQDCTLLELLDGTKSPPAVLESPNLLQAIASSHPSRFTETFIASGGWELPRSDVVSCQEAYQRLGQGLASIYPEWWTKVTARARAALGIPDAQVAPVLTTSYSTLLAAVSAPQEVLFQSALIKSFNEGVRIQAQLSGSDTYLLSLSLAQAEYQQRTGLSTMGRLAEQLLPVLRNALEGLLYGLFPLLFLLLLTPLGIPVLKAYAVGFLSLQFWAPIFAVLNLMMTIRAEKVLLPFQSPGLTIATFRSIDASSADLLAVSGALSLLVPVMAFALAAGSFSGIQHAMGTITSGSGSAASHTASTVGMGNVSTGNVGMNTLTANKYNPAREINVGSRMSSYSGPQGWYRQESSGWQKQGYGFRSESGGFVPYQTSEITPEGGATRLSIDSLESAVGMRLTQEKTNALQNRLSHVREALSQRATEVGRKLHESTKHGVGTGRSVTEEARVGESSSQETAAGRTRDTGRVQALVSSLQDRFGVNEQTAKVITDQALVSVGANLDMGVGFSSLGRLMGNLGLGGGVSGKGQTGSETRSVANLDKAFQYAYQSAQSLESKEILSYIDRASSTKTTSRGEAVSSSIQEETSAEKSKLTDQVNSLREQTGAAKRLEEQISRSETEGGRLSRNLGAEFLNHVAQQTGLPKEQVAGIIGNAAQRGQWKSTLLSGKPLEGWASDFMQRNLPSSTDLDARYRQADPSTSSKEADIKWDRSAIQKEVSDQLGEVSESIRGKEVDVTRRGETISGHVAERMVGNKRLFSEGDKLMDEGRGEMKGRGEASLENVKGLQEGSNMAEVLTRGHWEKAERIQEGLRSGNIGKEPASIFYLGNRIREAPLDEKEKD